MLSHVTQYEGKIPISEIGRLVGRCDPVILEIGAHDGLDSERLCLAFPAARLFCFEPDPRPAERWRQRMWERKEPYGVRFVQTALGAVDTPVPFYASTGEVDGHRDWDYSGSIRRPTRHLDRSPHIKFKHPELVPCTRLDTWAALELGLTPIDFIWADVQGGQRDLIEGGRQTLGSTRWLYVECHEESLYDGEPTQEELCALLPGFRLMTVYDTDNLLFGVCKELEVTQ